MQTLSDTYNCPDIKSRKKEKTVENIADIVTSADIGYDGFEIECSDDNTIVVTIVDQSKLMMVANLINVTVKNSGININKSSNKFTIK